MSLRMMSRVWVKVHDAENSSTGCSKPTCPTNSQKSGPYTKICAGSKGSARRCNRSYQELELFKMTSENPKP